MTDPIVWVLGAAQRWFRRRFRNPSRLWPASSVVDLTYDLDTRALNHVRVGAVVDDAQAFGPADQVTGFGPNPDLVYERLGLVVGAYEGKIVELRVVTDPASRALPAEQHCAPGRVRIRASDGRLRELSGQSERRDLHEAFGEPSEVDESGDECLLTFAKRRNYVEASLNKDSGRLTELSFSLFEPPNGPPVDAETVLRDANAKFTRSVFGWFLAAGVAGLGVLPFLARGGKNEFLPAFLLPLTLSWMACDWFSARFFRRAFNPPSRGDVAGRSLSDWLLSLVVLVATFYGAFLVLAASDYLRAGAFTPRWPWPVSLLFPA